MDFFKRVGKFEFMDIWFIDREPDTFEEFIGHSETVSVFKKYIKEGNIPNTILVGPYGSSKQTLAKIVSRTYLEEDYGKGCLIIDGSIDRGKDVISMAARRAKSNQPTVYEFANFKKSMKNNRKKLIIIYNFSDMTTEAQNALRRIMETCQHTTRFILITNTIDSIIEAIQSRCIQINMEGMKDKDYLEMEKHLGVSIRDKNIRKALEISCNGDYRKYVNICQILNASDEEITPETYYNVFSHAPVNVILSIIKDKMRGKPYHKRIKREIIDRGYSYSNTLKTVIDTIVFYDNPLPVKDKVKWLQHLIKSSKADNLHKPSFYIFYIFVY